MSAPFRVALREGIKLVMYGENGEAEYGGTTEYADLPGPSMGCICQNILFR